MGRVRPYDIEHVRDELTEVEATLQYDRQRGDYCSQVGKDTIRAERASDLERKVRLALRHGVGLEWARSIVVERFPATAPLSRSSRREAIVASVAIAVSRGEVSERRDGVLLYRDWPNEEIDEDLPDGLNPPDLRIVSALRGDVMVRPYSESAWRGLTSLALTLVRAAEAFESAQSIEDVRKALDLKALLKELEALNAPPRPVE